jgi:NADH dehydrogenase [ubiquinone] 1 alpha subcomplex assembly factor 6
MARGLSPVAEHVRRHDRDRFQTALFAPTAHREPLFALYAFNYEIASVRERVTEPMLGRIRLQWWREAVAEACATGPCRRHFLVEALAAAIRSRALSRAQFERLIDAREADLDEGAPASLAALEDYAEGTSARLIYLALEALGVRGSEAEAAAREVGLAYALAGLLRAAPFLARRRRPLIPADIVACTALSESDYLALRSTAALRSAAREIAAAAARHLAAARARRRRIPRAALPALLPAIIAGRALQRLDRAGFDLFAPSLAIPDPLQSWRLAAGALLNRF